MENPINNNGLYLDVPEQTISSSCIHLRDTGEAHRVIFYAGGLRILELCANGDIIVKGKLVENNKEVVEGMREFLSRNGGTTR